MNYLYLCVVFVLLVCFQSAYGQAATGSIEIFIKNENNDRVVPDGLSIKIYKDLENTPIKQIDFLKANPMVVESLPLGHTYKIEVYMNSMYAGVSFVSLQKNQQTEITIKNTGGMRLSVFYNDGQTPLQNAKVWIKSHDGKAWFYSETDKNGQTVRGWLYPTVKEGDFYVAEVSLGPNLKYVHSPIKLQPNVAQEFKIVTKWPIVIDKLITVEVYNNTKNKVSKQDGIFVAQLYDIKKKLVAESPVTDRGLAYFSNLKVNDYALYIKLKDQAGMLKTVASKKATITETVNLIKIYIHNPELNADHLNCNCVAFRLDDIQDFYLSPAQQAILDQFYQRKLPITLGVVGGVIGTDQNLVLQIKQGISENLIEVANHSWRHNQYTKMTKSEQENDIKMANKKISEIFNVTATTFIPPENLFTNETISILKANGFTHISYGETGPAEEPPKFTKSTFYHFPMYAYTARLDAQKGLWVQQTNEQILEQINDSLFNFGFAVVMMHPMEFSVYENGIYTNKVNTTKIGELASLLDKLNSQKIKILPINRIQDFDVQAPATRPQTEKPAPSCNCLAFRLDNVQDFWLNEVQNTVLDTFAKNSVPVTVTVIGKFTGDDPKTVSKIKMLQNFSEVSIGSRGWEYVDHTNYDEAAQAASMTKTNEKISKVFGTKAIIFSPPYDAFNDSTVSATAKNKIPYFSSTATKDRPLFSGSMMRLPTTDSFSDLASDDPFLSGTLQQKTIQKINSSLKLYGYSLISMQPSDFAVKNDVYKNQVNWDKIALLEQLISNARSNKINLVLMEKIPAMVVESSYMIPEWVKSNAAWWSEGKISDSEFVGAIQYLMDKKIIQVPKTQVGTTTQKIPSWVKSNAAWWSEGKITTSDFAKGIQYLIEVGIIKV